MAKNKEAEKQKFYPFTRDDHGDGILWYVDKNECHSDSLEDFLQSSCLGFCCCGVPEGNLKYIKIGLQILNRDMYNWPEYGEWHKTVLDHFKSDLAADFFWYWTDKEKLSEHGGCIPGWLTEKGKELLGLLEDLNQEEPS